MAILSNMTPPFANSSRDSLPFEVREMGYIYLANDKVLY